MFNKIFPSLELDITDLLEDSEFAPNNFFQCVSATWSCWSLVIQSRVAFSNEIPLSCRCCSAEIKEWFYLPFKLALNYTSVVCVCVCFIIQLQGNVESVEAWLCMSVETVMRTGISQLARLNSSVKSAIHR